jgi:hypothetical protein
VHPDSVSFYPAFKKSNKKREYGASFWTIGGFGSKNEIANVMEKLNATSTRDFIV